VGKHQVRFFRLLALSGVALVLSGCVSSILATRAVKAPNQQRPPRVMRDADYARRVDQLYTQAWRVKVGPPAADISVAVLEPGDYKFSYAIELKQNEKGHKWLAPKFDWVVPDQATATPLAAKGTLLLLHGYMDSKENVLHWALVLAEAGYRCVLVDFRGQGRSTGDVIGFGAFEVHDLALVLDDLQQKRLAPDKIGVLGVSYGASMGLLLAARDSRIAAIVALEPFSNAETAVVEFAHGVAPKEAAKISEATFKAGVAGAARRGKFSWAEGDVLAAMGRVKAPVLFYHGAKDRWLSPDNSRRLMAKAPSGSKLVILPDDDHILLSMRLDNIMVPDVRAWFDRNLAETASAASP
jgi:pimeloyl-ACP methyl ester carboxylesterase